MSISVYFHCHSTLHQSSFCTLLIHKLPALLAAAQYFQCSSIKYDICSLSQLISNSLWKYRRFPKIICSSQIVAFRLGVEKLRPNFKWLLLLICLFDLPYTCNSSRTHCQPLFFSSSPFREVTSVLCLSSLYSKSSILFLLFITSSNLSDSLISSQSLVQIGFHCCCSLICVLSQFFFLSHFLIPFSSLRFL